MLEYYRLNLQQIPACQAAPRDYDSEGTAEEGNVASGGKTPARLIMEGEDAPNPPGAS